MVRSYDGFRVRTKHLARQYYKAVWKTARMFVEQDPTLTKFILEEDLQQEGMIVLHHLIESDNYDVTKSKFLTYLYVCLFNKYKCLLRSAINKKRIEAVYILKNDLPTLTYCDISYDENGEYDKKLATLAMESLSKEEKAILDDKLHGVTLRTIGDKLGVSHETARSRWYKIKVKMRKELIKAGVDHYEY